MYFSQDYSFLKALYEAEISSIQLEGGEFDPSENCFVNVEALRFNLSNSENERTLRIYYDYQWFECHDEHSESNGIYGVCIGKIVEPSRHLLTVSSGKRNFKSVSADVIDIWSDDNEDMASFCNLYFDFESFILSMEYDLKNARLVISTTDVWLDLKSDNELSLRKILPNGKLS